MEEEEIKKWDDKFALCLGMEFSNPEYFKVHHILVITFMLQTGRYTPTYQNEAMSLLKEFLSHPLEAPTRSAIDVINTKFSSQNRDNRIVKKEMGDGFDTNITILDIRTDTADNYCKDVIAWAKEVFDKASL